MPNKSKIIVVFGKHDSQAIISYLREGHLWISNDQENRRILQKHIENLGEKPLENGVTWFSQNEFSEDLIDEILDHHDEFSDIPLSQLKIIGLLLTHELKSLLVAYRFNIEYYDAEIPLIITKPNSQE